MRPRVHKILVTGAAGFIGSAFVRLISNQSYKVVVVDKLTYAGDLNRLEPVWSKFVFYKTDICDKNKIESIFKKEKPETIVNFASETHVDRSIVNNLPFIETNIQGTQILLDAARRYNIAKFIHISTDEVYGDTKDDKFFEGSALNPSSPYSASKAAADMLLKSYIRTYSFPGIIIRPSNNYGPWQYPEKLIPLAILKILRNECVPIYADGRNVREWLYVEDCSNAILEITKKGKIGEVYNLGSNIEMQNIEVVYMILRLLKASKNLIQFVRDRPGHDIRYRLNSEKFMNETGWQPRINFENGIKLTVNWCIKHKNWLLTKYKDVAKLYKY